MSDRSTKPWGNQRELNSDGLRALGSIERAVQTSSDQSYPRIESTLAPKHRYASTGLRPYAQKAYGPLLIIPANKPAFTPAITGIRILNSQTFDND